MVFRETKFSFSVSITETLLARGHWDWELCDAETLDSTASTFSNQLHVTSAEEEDPCVMEA